MAMSILKDKMDGTSYHEKADYMAMAHELMNDMKTHGCISPNKPKGRYLWFPTEQEILKWI